MVRLDESWDLNESLYDVTMTGIKATWHMDCGGTGWENASDFYTDTVLSC
ncbi:hypothetical protein A176_003810 [Myxococcus hansupus]|uniref:Uncharacterized protein n=1 Tax=Pseudomyxococcus hansupus TaxID=1297742 RepID=A0A0H4WZ45_9BACT|nr:hypothetical protein A176_003810 [Myxococcus hansupus]